MSTAAERCIHFCVLSMARVIAVNSVRRLASTGRHLYRIDLSGAQRRRVLSHGAIGPAIELLRVETSAPDILLQTAPRRRHLAHGGKAHAEQIRHSEIATRLASDEQERISRHDLAETRENRIRLPVARDHDTHRPSPTDIRRAGGHRASSVFGTRRALENDLEPLVSIGAERERRIERRIEDGAQRLLKNDGHKCASKSESPMPPAQRAFVPFGPAKDLPVTAGG